jgi:rare lipoprotein A (peptidoglycan hydrolase)
MNAALARRQAALAGVALVGALGAIALTHVGDGSSEPPARQAVVEWEEAQVATFAVTAESTACGATLAPNAFGVAHPVLPCGAKLLLDYQGRRAQAEVVDRGPVDAGRSFDLTPALAQQLGIAGEATVRWRFAD